MRHADQGLKMPSTLTFEVTFDPSAAGLRAAILIITHNDLPQNPFVFTLRGTGL